MTVACRKNTGQRPPEVEMTGPGAFKERAKITHPDVVKGKDRDVVCCRWGRGECGSVKDYAEPPFCWGCHGAMSTWRD